MYAVLKPEWVTKPESQQRTVELDKAELANRAARPPVASERTLPSAPAASGTATS